MSLYGPMVTPEDVRLALESHLVAWTPAYIAEVGRQRGETLPPFRGFGGGSADTFPVCIIAVADTVGSPAKHGDGAITATYTAAAVALTAGVTRERATAVAGWYGAAIRGAVLQHPDLTGFASSTEWAAENFEEVSFTTDLAIMACYERFTITVDNILNVQMGPPTPPANPATPPGDFPEVVLVGDLIVRDPTT